MEFKKNSLLIAMTASLALGLSACGSNDSNSTGSGVAGLVGSSGDASGTGTGTTTTGSATVNPAHTIVLTYPITDAIENVGGGVYRRLVSAMVTDNEGNPVPDGTKVFLNVIDTILAQGTIDSAAGDSITGSALTDVNPTLADGVTATTFDTAYAVRNGAYHFVHEGDHVFLTSNAYDPNVTPNSFVSDKNRLVDSFTANVVNVTTGYNNDYPNSTYATGVTDYVVGVSALGAEVLGKDAAASSSSTSSTTSTTDTTSDTTSSSSSTSSSYVNEGYSTTQNGVANFYITYPANVNTIHTGCTDDTDRRVFPLESGKVMVVASAGTEATTIDQRFCFGSIIPWTMDKIPAEIGEGTYSVTVTPRDGGDTIPIPYERIFTNVKVTSGSISVTLAKTSDASSAPFYTDRYGDADIDVTITDMSANHAGGTVEITFSTTYSSASYSVTVEDTSGG